VAKFTTLTPLSLLSWCRLSFPIVGLKISASPNPQAGGPPLVGCPRLLIQYIRSYPPHRRPFLHPHPEDVPCRGDRDRLIIMLSYDNYIHYNCQHNYVMVFIKAICFDSHESFSDLMYVITLQGIIHCFLWTFRPQFSDWYYDNRGCRI
jgi:hypothetical protein